MIAIQSNSGDDGCVGDIVSSVYRPGIFKRIFISDLKYGFKYITASSMLSQDAILFSKVLSKKRTANIDPMILRPKMMLVSCAGSVGDTRLIGEDLNGVIGSQDIIRVVPNNDNFGFVYAYLSSKTVYDYIQSLIYGSVVFRIEPEVIQRLPLLKINNATKCEVNSLIEEAYILRNQASELLSESSRKLLEYVCLPELSSDSYEYFGPRSYGREVSSYSISSKEVGTISINAFNHSEKIRKLKAAIPVHSLPLCDVLDEKQFFSTGAFPRVEVKSDRGVMLINQSDIFDTPLKGKMISRRGVALSSLVEYGEVIIAGVGTLGENETFCRVIFANEDLEGQLISGEFIRMRVNEEIPSGYLYAWLSSEYGFRFIRSTQSGTKLCRPIPRLLSQIPVPLIQQAQMLEIDCLVRDAFTKRHEANKKEQEAIKIIDLEFAKWYNN